jgi:hypothetical protein
MPPYPTYERKAHNLYYNPPKNKCKYILPDFFINSFSFKFETSSKCALVHFQLFSPLHLLCWFSYDAPTSYSPTEKNPWTPVHELLHHMSTFFGCSLHFRNWHLQSGVPSISPSIQNMFFSGFFYQFFDQ